MSKRRWMALDTLFTFWPPAPWARMGVKVISWRGIVRLLLIGSTMAVVVISGIKFRHLLMNRATSLNSKAYPDMIGGWIANVYKSLQNISIR
jgi:hypothetical protein